MVGVSVLMLSLLMRVGSCFLASALIFVFDVK